MVISLIRRVKYLPRLASRAALFVLIAHLDGPDMVTSTACNRLVLTIFIIQ